MLMIYVLWLSECPAAMALTAAIITPEPKLSYVGAHIHAFCACHQCGKHKSQTPRPTPRSKDPAPTGTWL